VSRSVIFPILGLVAIVLVGLNRTGRVAPDPSVPTDDRIDVTFDAEPPAAFSLPPPPPGPRLRSEVVAEEPSADVPRPAPPDSTGRSDMGTAAPAEEPPFGAGASADAALFGN